MREFDVTVNADYGGRWSGLTDPNGRQWLWSRPNPARFSVSPGDAFVDIGGLEECFPTLGDDPDHGALWTRPWQTLVNNGRHQEHQVSYDTVTLRRTIDTSPSNIVANYFLTAPPQTRFIWAAHTLLELDLGARIVAAEGPARAWPDHRTLISGSWPRPTGHNFSVLGPDDGSAMFCLLPDREVVAVIDGADTLRFRLRCEGQPVSVGLWRNLGGYPWLAPHKYRNIGIEPMLGNVFDLDAAGPGDTAVVPRSGSVRWQLQIDNGHE